MPTLATVLKIFLQIDRSPDTNRNYANLLNRMAEGLGTVRAIDRITYEDLIDFTAALRPGISQSTFVQYVRILKIFFTWCVQQRYLEFSPAAGLVARKPPRDPGLDRAIPQDDLEKMLALARYNVRDFALLLFLVDTSCRIGGLASLRVSRLDLEKQTALILEKGGKWKSVYFGETTTRALRAWLKLRPSVDHDMVFTRPADGAPFAKSGMKGLIYRLSLRACGHRYGAHSIRHAVGHAYAKAGLPAYVTQSKLNHSSVKTTLDYYYPTVAENLPEISREFDLAPLRRDPKPAAGEGTEKSKIINFRDYA